ncbi:hypothetical protein JRQ81_007735 [Phrynocephalus forsythii]|uniref:Large ribosomal subunit protein mL40 n=1 Tax=Phrynocephalus forsythii TaxID=171643 RepID=A0A9Q0XE64_9SAUR|nr:hypothetical protein JRQ81_007735 [Phrynocephalus forsythii]
MFAPRALTLLRSRIGGSSLSPQLMWNVQHRTSHWQSSLLGLRVALPMRAMPPKKKKVDPRMELAARERLKKKIRRVRPVAPLSPEESERRALLMKRWSVYRQEQHKAETEAIRSLVEAQAQALEELRLESEELYQAAIQRDDHLFPFERQEPLYSPPLSNYEAPEGKCADVTPVYTQ